MITREQWIKYADGYLPEQTVADCRKYGDSHYKQMSDYIEIQKDEWRTRPEYQGLSDGAYHTELSRIVTEMTQFLDDLAPTIPIDPKQMKLKEVDILDGNDYGSKWGLTDLYEEVEAKLLEAIKDSMATKVPFKTYWGARKEIYYTTLTFYGPTAVVKARSEMDSMGDLVDTIVSELAQAKNVTCDYAYSGLMSFFPELSDEDVNNVVDALVENLTDPYMYETDEDNCPYGEFELEIELTDNPEQNLELIKVALEQAENEAVKQGETTYNNIKESVAGTLEWLQENPKSLQAWARTGLAEYVED